MKIILSILTISLISLFSIELSDSNHNDLKRFINKEISVFLQDSSYSNYQKIQFIDNKPGVLSAVHIIYANNKTIALYINEFKHVTPFSIDLEWDLEKVKKEKISRIEVYEDDKYVFDSGRD